MSDLEREELKKLVKQAMREQLPSLLEDVQLAEPDWVRELRTKFEKLETQQKEQSETKGCPDCKAQVKKKDRYCHNCGEDLEDEGW